MSLKYSVYLSTGFVGELASFEDPIEAYETLTHVAQTADELGFETVWLLDHFHPLLPSQAMFFESWTTAAAFARDTRRVRIGHLVTGNNYRNPALQAKMASTLDVLSHGRYTFGIGAGWHEHEYHAYGYQYSDAKTRLRQLDEAVQVIRTMWTQEETTFEGNYYQVRGAINQPKGVQQPHIPMMIAGSGERVTLKLVAQYADACNVQGNIATIEHKFDVMRAHCEAVGRSYESIHRTALTLCALADTDEQAHALVPGWAPLVSPDPDIQSYGLVGTLETIRQRLAAYEAAGVQELVISFSDTPQLDTMRRFAREFIQ
jgi:F420-dependent oxidoreductase-like protein